MFEVCYIMVSTSEAIPIFTYAIDGVAVLAFLVAVFKVVTSWPNRK